MGEIGQLASTGLLRSNGRSCDNQTNCGPEPLPPWQVRLSEDYIRANWSEPIKIETLAAITNSSVRSLFHLFRQSRGYSPMEFVKHIRLQHARKMLTNAKSATTVTSVAFACGFGNLGHFAKDYRDKFGELPSRSISS